VRVMQPATDPYHLNQTNLNLRTIPTGTVVHMQNVTCRHTKPTEVWIHRQTKTQIENRIVYINIYQIPCTHRD